MATKTRLSVYLEPELMRALAHYADRRGHSRSLVAEAAIASFLSPDADSQREAAMVKRLDRLDRRLDRLERDLGIGIETLALFVRFWLATTPPLPEQARAAAQAAGGARYDQFVEALGRRLARGQKLRLEIPEEIDAAFGAAANHADGADGAPGD